MAAPFHSKSKNSKNGTAINSPLTVSTTLVCNAQRRMRKRFRFRSSQKKNPRQPTTISTISTRLMSTSPETVVMEDRDARAPIRSNPALQKAETE